MKFLIFSDLFLGQRPEPASWKQCHDSGLLNLPIAALLVRSSKYLFQKRMDDIFTIFRLELDSPAIIIDSSRQFSANCYSKLTLLKNCWIGLVCPSFKTKTCLGYLNLENSFGGTYSYSTFKNFGPTSSIWSFLEIFRIILGEKIELFKIALPARPSGSFYLAILKTSIFSHKIILKFSKYDQISETGQNIWTHCNKTRSEI